ncbi:LysR family substrate-binding domain-containing protein [Micrococcus terreus]|nr:LysR family substrate-binding domain-containing protein [Micrococcus terreus]MDK7700134.1 LysR family substrate-binding domain-containing protein [Micrococcus terreus]WOO99012.1 LysR family substrate-binding domain-containing protein [Micrococcus terreus]
MVRGGRGIALTRAGAVLAEVASGLLRHADQLLPKVRSAGLSESGSLTLGSVSIACATVAPALLNSFRRTSPQVNVSLLAMSSVQLYDALIRGSVDVALARATTPIPGIDVQVIVEERVLMAVPLDHPQAGRSAPLSTFRNDSFVLYTRRLGAHHYDDLMAACQTIGKFCPAVRVEAESLTSQQAMISAGYGVGFVTELSRHLDTPGLAYVDIEDLTLRVPLVAARRNENTSPVIERFYDTILMTHG